MLIKCFSYLEINISLTREEIINLTENLSLMKVSKTPPSIILEKLTWIEAESALKNSEVVLLALGARMKEHGPHLPLNTDYIIAEYLKEQVIKKIPVIVLPTLQYGYYPSFLEYPGSISIRAETFKDMIVDICKSMNGYGKKKFYIINTGISTLKPLETAAKELLENAIILRYLNLLDTDKNIKILEQEGGTHADEGETSMMLYIAPEVVDMSKAEKDYDSRPNRKGLTRDPRGEGIYSKTGIYGNPTLANKEKGKVIIDFLIKHIVKEIKEL